MCSPALVPWGSQPAPEEGARAGNRPIRGRKMQWGGTPVSPASPLGAGIRVITPPPAAHAALSSLSLHGPEQQRDPGESCKAAEPCLAGWPLPRTGTARAPSAHGQHVPGEGRVQLQRGRGKPGGTQVF